LDIPELYAKGLNNTSAVLRIINSSSSALLTGDLEPDGWKELCRSYPTADLQSDLLKFPHHGGAWKSKNVNDLLDVVNPSIVIISVGSKGYEKYTHPHPDVFEALKKRPNIHLLCTQATNQCQQNVMAQRGTISDLLTKQASKNGQKLIGSNRGCPCAGTIVVELGENAQVVQPETLFHQQIIIPYFENHQCRFGRVVTAVAEDSAESFDAPSRG
jgi:competence protein ComEC